jgi:parallel beta-helix repeat protein
VTYSTNQFNVSENLFSNCWSGIKVQTAGGGLTVNGNTFSKCNDGLDVTSGAVITIQNNLIDSCARDGINGGGFIESNTISNNQVGIHNPFSGSVISSNNIVGNSQYSVTATTSSINAQGNWWGTTDTPTINQTIYDAKCDPSLGIISFAPFLASPNMLAPTIPASTPILTAIPTANPTPIPKPVPLSPTAIPTPLPTPIEPTPKQTSEQPNSVINDTGSLLNLNLITSAVEILLTVTWIIVILGYAAKSGISKYKTKNKKPQRKSD